MLKTICSSEWIYSNPHYFPIHTPLSLSFSSQSSLLNTNPSATSTLLVFACCFDPMNLTRAIYMTLGLELLPFRDWWVHN